MLAKRSASGEIDKHLPNDPLADLTERIKEQTDTGFDIDELCDDGLEMPDRPAQTYDLRFLDDVLNDSRLLPPGYAAKRLSSREYEYWAPGNRSAIRVTTDRDYYEAHPESIELWSPGSPAFPWKEAQRFIKK